MVRLGEEIRITLTLEWDVTSLVLCNHPLYSLTPKDQVVIIRIRGWSKLELKSGLT